MGPRHRDRGWACPSIRIAEKLGQRLELTENVDGADVYTYGIHRIDAAAPADERRMD